MSVDPWPGGRTPLAHGRYLPRFLTKLPKDQQAILESPHAWQPSISNRQIGGSVPIKVLAYFQELADKAGIGATGNKELKGSLSPGSRQEDRQHFSGPEHGDSESELQTSQSEASESAEPWSPTPRSPAAERPALPENSSPLHTSHGQLAQSLLQAGSPVTRTDVFYTQLQRSQKEASPDIEEPAKTPSKGLKLNETCQHDESDGSMDHQSPGQEQNLDGCEPKFRETDESQFRREDALRSSHVESGESDIQTTVQHGNSESKPLIQVHRTPFGNQPSASQRIAAFPHQAASLRDTATGEASSSNQEPRSSVSVVPGTFSNNHVEDLAQVQESYEASPGQNEISGGGERTVLGRGQVDDTPASADMPEAASQVYRSRCHQTIEGQLCPSESRGVKRSRSRGDESRCRVQKPRLATNFPASDGLGGISTAQTASEIARESRRAFFRNHPPAARSSSLVSVAKPSQTELEREQRMLGSSSIRQDGSDVQQKFALEARPTCLSGQANLEHASEGHATSRTSDNQQNVYDTYKATYPEYRGDRLAFRKACKQIRVLDKEGRSPHPCLWDDFVFCRHHEYREYLLHVAEACEDALPYVQYYNKYIEKPSRLRLVVKPSYLTSLAGDSAVGSSVDSPALAALANPQASFDLDAGSGPTSPMLAGRPTPAACIPDIGTEESHCATQDDVQPRPKQDSPVREWVHQQSMQRALGAASPELGSAADDRVKAVEQVLEHQSAEEATEMPASPLLSHEVKSKSREQQKPTSRWCDDPDTPFKSFVRSYTSLTQEKRQSKEAIQLDANGRLKPHLRSVIDIFSLYRK